MTNHDEPGLTGASPLSQGDLVAGRYRVLEEIGRGGYAIVYKAVDSTTDETIALKTIRPIAPRPHEVVARFRREAEMVSRLQHPNTVRVFDYGFEGDLYLAMELLNGYPLSDILDGVRGITLRRAVAIANGVLSALTEAHALGIVHRDLKPENVFLVQQSDGREIVKVLDFGIAKTVYEDGSPVLTLKGRAMGTPTYMSPEQAKGAPLTIRSDIYAVAVLIYEMLCGVPPFQGDGAMDIMLKHVNEPPPPVTVPELRGTPFDWAIQKGLSKKPENRFRDAHEFLAALGGTAVTVAGARPTAAPVPAPDENDRGGLLSKVFGRRG
ncbi:MAG: serine/threonine protein kinase [Myxococcales bacterium]|nr:serine/threonine protein kinase [Myxococcales bacterium]MCB9520586.1 serine/threonine protein kinase [Myxococcales bacterium]MCB9531509.1 serine/threonine protein kinase [Myxococcales bacterium]